MSPALTGPLPSTSRLNYGSSSDKTWQTDLSLLFASFSTFVVGSLGSLSSSIKMLSTLYSSAESLSKQFRRLEGVVDMVIVVDMESDLIGMGVQWLLYFEMLEKCDVKSFDGSVLGITYYGCSYLFFTYSLLICDPMRRAMMSPPETRQGLPRAR